MGVIEKQIKVQNKIFFVAFLIFFRKMIILSDFRIRWRPHKSRA